MQKEGLIMNRTGRRTSAYVLAASVVVAALLAATAVFIAVAADPPPPALQNAGLQNAGFEQGLDFWTVSEDRPGNVSVVSTETPQMYPTYALMGNVTVTPFSGSKMLRLGVPRDKNNHQLRGVNTCSQSFVPTSDRISIGIRLFSWEERRERGSFIIDVKRADGRSIGTVTAANPDILPTKNPVPTGPLPFVLPMDRDHIDYLASDWIRLDIAGLSTDETVTLSYTLTNTHDASHDSWVYVDWANSVPVAPNETFAATEDQALPFTLGASDPDGDPLYYTIPAVTAMGGTLTGTAPHLIYVPPPNFNGTDTFSYTVDDLHGGIATANVKLDVAAVNDPPVLAPIGNRTVNENALLTIQLSATDVDEDPLSYSADNLPSGSTFTTATGTFNWKPTYDQSDSYPDVTFTVSDGQGGTASESITITVNNVNRAPVAVIDWGPESGHEGDMAGVYGGNSYDPDADVGDSIVSRQWTVTAPDGTQLANGADGSFWIPRTQGDYVVKLTLTDESGMVGEAQTTISVNDFPPLVNAVDAEVLDGGTATVMARTLDQGWLDDHAASWDLAGAVAGGVADDHVAAMSSGIVTATVSAGDRHSGEFSGLVTVSDASLASSAGTDTITIRVVGNDPTRFESGTSVQPDLHDLDSLPKLESDWSYLSWIQQPGDVDVYEIRGANGAPLKQGTECLISLKDLPTDYDLVVLSTTPSNETTSSLQNAPLATNEWGTARWNWSRWNWSRWNWSELADSRWNWSRWNWSEWADSRWNWSRWNWSELADSRWNWSPFPGDDIVRDPWNHGPWSHFASSWSTAGRNEESDAVSEWGSWLKNPLNGYPFEEMSYTGLDGSTISGTDIDAGELGLDLEGTGLHVVGSSADRGTQDEVVLATSELSTSRMFVAVVGHLESFSSLPYRLQIEESRPNDLFDIAATDIVNTPLLSTNPPQSVSEVTSEPLTLFVTQRERMEALYGQSETDQLYTKLQTLSTNSKVKGAILSVESGTWFDNWDTKPNDIQLANTVADHVRAEVRNYITAHPAVKYVVLVGNDEVVPYRRVADETVISNESKYASDAGLRLDSPLLASMYSGFNLSDDFYVDDLPTPWQGRALYLPDRAVSRLVETPTEMGTQIDAFLAQNGELKSQTAMVSGYDFMTDGSQRVADILSGAQLTVTAMNNDAWTASELKANLIDSPKDVCVPNAHYTHYAAISASGFWRSETDGTFDPAELITSQDLVSSSPMDFAGRLFMTMGCHAGLSVPDADARDTDAITGLGSALDFAQTVTRQGGVFIGSLGFGLGETNGIAGTEALMGYFASKATSGGGISIGDALAQAKKSYIMGLSAVSVYDEKSSIQFAMYGLPQWTLPVTSSAQPSSATGSVDAAAMLPLGTSFSPQPFILHVIDNGVPLPDRTFSVDQVLATNGEYFTADGDAQFTPLRPAQPRVVLPLSDGMPVHGVIYRSATYQEIGPDYDPVIVRPSTDWEALPQEPQAASDGWWPNEPVVVNNDETKDGGLAQTLVITPGQFKAEARTPKVVGTERLYSDLTVEILRSASTTDFVAPTVSDIRLIQVDPTHLRISVKARDESGIGLINVVDPTGTSFGSTDFTDVPTDGNDWYSVEIVVPAGTTEYNLILQVADIWRNVTTVTRKGETVLPLAISLTPRSPTYALGTPVVFDAKIENFTSLRQPVWYYVDFRDGSNLRGTVVDVGPDGTAAVSFSHTYSTPAVGPVLFSISDAAGVTGGTSARLELQRDENYVSPTGDDTTGDGSIDAPFRTPHRALPVTVTNGTIWVLPGDYADNVVFTRPVNLKATDPSQLPMVDAADPSQPTISVNGVTQGITIEGIAFDGTGTTDGILKIVDSSVVASACAFSNGTSQTGGAISVTGGTLTVNRCDITGSLATSSGGGIHAENSVVHIADSNISGNMAAAAAGGGLFFKDSTATIDRSTVTTNAGGGISSQTSALRITNCLIAKNSDGGVNVSGTAATFVNDTIADNSSSAGGGIHSTGATSTVFNSILSGNQAAGQPQQADGCYIGYSYVGPNANDEAVNFGPGIVRDRFGPPGFVDAAGGDYRLQSTSVCVDAGAASWGGLNAPSVDLVRATRPYGSGFDVGAYERHAPLGPLDDIYVSTTGNDANTGTATRPKLTIQAGLDAVTAGGRVHVFAGTYTANLSISREVTLLSEDGALAASIKGTGTDSVIEITAPGVKIDGFVISGGKSPANGGGVDLGSAGAAVIATCTITENTAAGYGGGLYTYRAGLQLLNTSVKNNTAGLDGGGACMFLYSGTSEPAATTVIRGGTFSGNAARNGGAIAGRFGPITIQGINATANTASGYGGAIDLDSVSSAASEPLISQALIQSNTAASGGAAIALRGTSSGACVNSVLDSNRVTGSMGEGGGFALGTGPIAIVNSTITRNRAYWGSAVSWGDAPATVFNCIFWKNSSSKSQFSSPNSRTLPTPSYSFVDDSSAKFNNNFGGLRADPSFVNVSLNDFSLLPGSICIDKGASTFNGVSAPLIDKAGRSRPYNLLWDAGAFEFYP